MLSWDEFNEEDTTAAPALPPRSRQARPQPSWTTTTPVP